VWDSFSLGLLLVFFSALITFIALIREKDDLHKLLLLLLLQILLIGIIALIGTDLAEAMVLAVLLVGIAEIIALTQIFVNKEGITCKRVRSLDIEVITLGKAPVILSVLLICYGIVLSGLAGGIIAGLGIVFFFMCNGYREPFAIIEIAAGLSFAIWIISFLVFMFLPQYWLFALMGAATGILFQVLAKLALAGTMWEGYHE